MVPVTLRLTRLTSCRGEASVLSASLITLMLVTGEALSLQRAFTRAYANLITQQLSVWDDMQRFSQPSARFNIRPN